MRLMGVGGGGAWLFKPTTTSSQPTPLSQEEGRGSMVCPASDIAGTSKIYTESGFSGASGHFLLHPHPACLSPIKIPTMPQICSTCLFDHQICPEIPQTSFLLTFLFHSGFELIFFPTMFLKQHQNQHGHRFNQNSDLSSIEKIELLSNILYSINGVS